MKIRHIQHYYGDFVRIYFFLGAAIMLISLPFVNDKIGVSIPISLFAILVLALFAGLTNPRHMWVSAINVVISAIALLTFEYFAVKFFLQFDQDKFLFFVNQILAIDFLFALYYASKTLRGYYAKEVNFTEEK